MVVDTMPDEYYERYRPLSHEQLYAMLRAGSPGQINTVARTWKSIQDTVAGLAATLRQDLDRLRLSWTGPASEEYQYRVGLIASYAQRLAEQADLIRTGLTVMSDALARAQQQAEQPDAIETFATTMDGAVGAVVGSALGHSLVEEERTAAHERMAQLVATLAAEYGVTDHGTWPAQIVPAPADLPGEPVVAVLDGARPGTRLLGMVGVRPHETTPAGIAPLLEHGATTGRPVPVGALPAGTLPAGARPATGLGGALAASTGLSGIPAGGPLAQPPAADARAGATAPQVPPPVMGGGAPMGPVGDTQSAVGSRLAPDARMAWQTRDSIEWSSDHTAPPAILDSDEELD